MGNPFFSRIGEVSRIFNLCNRLAVLLLVSSLSISSQAATTSSWQAYIDGYLAGQDVSALGAQLDKTREPATEEPTSSKQLHDGLVSFLVKLQAVLPASDSKISNLSALIHADLHAVKALEPDYLQVVAYHQLYLARFDVVIAKLNETGNEQYIPAVEKTKKHYLDGINPFLTAMNTLFTSLQTLPESTPDDTFLTQLKNALQAPGAMWDASALQVVIAELMPAMQDQQPDFLRANTLPYRSLNVAGKQPDTANTITPSYQETVAAVSMPEDIAESSQAVFTDAIRAKAEELQHDPIKLFEFVQGQIKTQWYAGAMKNADTVLQEGAGNDTDQASLLIALLRASNIPARYVRGVIDLPVGIIQQQLGIVNPTDITILLRKAGYAVEPVIRGGAVASFRVEHTWVSAMVPYANYRGAVVDTAGNVWLPLFPALKSWTRTEQPGLLKGMQLDTAALFNSYLTSVQTASPVEQVRTQVASYIAEQKITIPYAQQIVPASITQNLPGYLPNSLPVDVLAVNAESVELAADLIHQVHFYVYADESGTGQPVLDWQKPLSSLAGQRITLSWQPGTLEDQHLINSMGGLYSTPAYLLSLRPQVKLNGMVQAVGQQTVRMANRQRVVIEVSGPYGMERINKNVIAGGYHAIALDAQTISDRSTLAETPQDTEFLGARLLAQSALRYLSAWGQAEDELAALGNLALVRPAPAVVFVSNALTVDYLLQQPEKLNWLGVEMDAALRVAEVVPVDANAITPSNWRRLSGMQGSYLEHRGFEQDFFTDSISADKGIALANGENQVIAVLDKNNIDDVLPSLQHPSAVLQNILEQVQSGLVVRVPQKTVQHKLWSGSVWIAEDLQTGAAGYFIARDLAGGSTADTMPPEFMNPFSNPDLDLAAYGTPYKIVMVPGSDHQVIEVGQISKPIKVMVVNTNNQRVPGVEVTFSIPQGSSGSLTAATSITDGAGMAETTVMMPVLINQNLAYATLNDSDKFQTRVSMVYVTASAPAPDDDHPYKRVTLPTGFVLVAKPGPLDRVIQLNTYSSGGKHWPTNMDVLAVDQYDNLVANADIKVTSLTQKGQDDPGEVCDEYKLPIPSYGGCSQSANQKTDALGSARFLVFAGSFLPAPEENSGLFKFQAEGADSAFEIYFNFGAKYIYQFWSSNPPLPATNAGQSYLGEYQVIITGFDEHNDKVEFKSDSGKPVYKEIEPGNYIIESIPTAASPKKNIPTLVHSYKNDRGDNVDASYDMPAVAGAKSTLHTGKVHLDENGQAGFIKVDVAVVPGYKVTWGKLELKENGSTIAEYPLTIQGINNITALLPSGIPYDLQKNYTVEAVLDNGSPSEVRSQSFTLDFDQETIISPLNNFQKSGSTEVDIANQWSCNRTPPDFEFVISQGANVVIRIGESEIANEHFNKGKHSIPMPPVVVDGIYSLSISTTSDFDGHVETKKGVFIQRNTYRDALPVGHANAENVDLFDGHLTLSSTDFTMPARGKKIEFTRSYSSNNFERSPLGDGWTHQYNSYVVDGGCGTYFVVGGDGGGVRFFPGDGAVLKPGKGYHSSLKPAENGWDFYSKDGTQYHYRHFAFDEAKTWHLDYIQDTNGNLTKLSYNPASDAAEVSGIIDSSGHELKITYKDLQLNYHYLGLDFPSNPRLITSIEGSGLAVTYLYDGRGRLKSATRSNGYKEEYEYTVPEDDGSGDSNAGGSGSLMDEKYYQRVAIKSAYDANGNRTEYTHETKEMFVAGMPGNVQLPFVSSVKRPASGKISFEYGTRTERADGMTSSVTYAKGRHDYTLNTYGSPLTISTPAGNRAMTWSLTDVLMESVKNEKNIKTRYEYDAYGNVTEENVDGMEPIISTYKLLKIDLIKDRIGSRRDRNGNTTRYDYDGNGNLISAISPKCNQTFGYDGNGDRKSATDCNGTNTTKYRYDKDGNVENITDANGFVSAAAWNPRGTKKSETNALGSTTSYEYDLFDHLKSATNPLSGARQYVYDKLGNKLSEKDENGHNTQWDYDAENRITKITDAEGHRRTLEYDNNGNLILETNFRGHPTTYGYDNANRQTNVNMPLGRNIVRTFDGVGNVLTETDARGNTTTYTYDNLSRKTSTSYSGGGGEWLTLDGNGNALTVKDGLNRVTTQTFDANNNRLTQAMPMGKTLVWTYDKNGNALTAQDGNGGITKYEYNKRNQQIQKTEPCGQNSTGCPKVSFTHYDNAGNVTLLTNAKNIAESFTYNNINWKLSHTDLGGNITTYTHDHVGNVVTEKLPNGNVVTNEYDALNRLKLKSDNLGDVVAHDYDNDGNVISTTDANGNHTGFDVDALNQTTKATLPWGLVQNTVYDSVGNILSRTDDHGVELTYTYDARNRPQSESNGKGTRLFSYDHVGNKLSETDFNGNNTGYDYDDLNRVKKVTDALGQTIINTYDSNNNLLTTTDKRKIDTSYTYDDTNHLLTTKRDNILVLTNQYDPVGNRIRTIDAKNNATAYEYNSRNLLILESRPLAAITGYDYDSMGNKTLERDPEQRSTTFEYNKRNCLNKTTTADGDTLYECDGNGNHTSMMRPSGNQWGYTYTKANMLETVTAPGGGVTTYGYDTHNNVISMTDALGYDTSYPHDNLNCRTGIDYPDGASESFTCTPNGEVETHADANGNGFMFTYDGLNREKDRDVTSVQTGLPNEGDITNTHTEYDENNNVTSRTDTFANAVREEKFGYDNFDRMKSHTDSFGNVTNFTYDLNGNRLTLSDSSGITAYTPDALNRMEYVDGTHYTYYRDSQLKSANYSNNGTSEDRTYDNMGRVKTISNNQSGAVVSSFAYEYDNNGNRQQQTEINGGAAEVTLYDYDDLDRLEKVIYPTTTTEYTYDANYNRKTEIVTDNATGTVSKNIGLVYNNRNQLITITDLLSAANNITYGYDANGNQIQKVKGEDTQEFIFDAKNQLRAVYAQP